MTLALILVSLAAAGAWWVVVPTAALLWMLSVWRAHPRYGRRRGRPPGSLGLRRSLCALGDPAFYRREAARHGPIFKMAEFHRPVVCVIGLDAGRRILRDHGAALRPAVRPPLADAVPGGFLRYMSPADHAVYAPLFRAAMAGPVLTHLETCARAAIRDALTTLAAASAPPATAGVDPRDALDRALSITLSKLFFGGLLRAEDQATFDACARDADLRTAVLWASPRAKRALARFTALIATRGATYDGAGDHSIWAELVRLDPARARSATVSGNLFLLVKDARSNLRDLLIGIVKRLGDAPGWTARVRNDASRDDPATRVVLETLRLADDCLYREVRQPITFDGFTVPRGWLLRICLRESHLQDPPFVDPERFNPDRHCGVGHTANALAPFGLDQHACIAARLSLLFGLVLAAELIEHFECTVVADGPPARVKRHWALWQPSADLRVVVRRRDERRTA